MAPIYAHVSCAIVVDRSVLGTDEVRVSTTLRPLPASRIFDRHFPRLQRLNAALSVPGSGSIASYANPTKPTQQRPSRSSAARQFALRCSATPHLVPYDGALDANFGSSWSSTAARFRSRPVYDLARPSAPARDCTSFNLTAVPSLTCSSVIRQPALSRVLTKEVVDIRIAPTQWWFNRCRRPHRVVNCELHCSDGQSHKACPHQHSAGARAPSATDRRGAAPTCRSSSASDFASP